MGALRVGRHLAVEPLVVAAWAGQLDRASRTGSAALALVAPCSVLHRMRLRKEPEELERLREAGRISAAAHELARSVVKPGMRERQVQALIEEHFLAQPLGIIVATIAFGMGIDKQDVSDAHNQMK